MSDEVGSIWEAEKQAIAEADSNRRSFTSWKLDKQRLILACPLMGWKGKLVTVKLLSFVSEKTGIACPSQFTLADELGVSRPTVQRGLEESKKAGWINSARHGKNSNSYLFPENERHEDAILERLDFLRQCRERERLDASTRMRRGALNASTRMPLDASTRMHKHLPLTPSGLSTEEEGNPYARQAKGS